MMIEYRVIVEGETQDGQHAFDGEPQINLTFEMNGGVYRVTSRAHDEHATSPTIHAVHI